MLLCPSSSAAVFVSPRTPHLLATYAPTPNVPVNPAPEEILTIEPPPALRIEDATARIPQIRASQVDVDHLSPDRRLGLRDHSEAHDARVVTSTETGPKASSEAATVADQSLSLVTSRREKIA